MFELHVWLYEMGNESTGFASHLPPYQTCSTNNCFNSCRCSNLFENVLSMNFYSIGVPMISGNTAKMFRIWWQREIGTKANKFKYVDVCKTFNFNAHYVLIMCFTCTCLKLKHYVKLLTQCTNYLFEHSTFIT